METPSSRANLIATLHARHDGYVTYHGPQFNMTQAVRGHDLIAPSRATTTTVPTEGYVSINAFRIPRRLEDHLRWLTATFTDLDYYALGLTRDEVLNRLRECQKNGVIPPPSMTSSSGRGVWLFWFLREDTNPASAVRAWPERVVLWKRIQREIYSRLAALGADLSATDVSRVTRIPGSLNAKVNRRVRYRILADSTGEHPTYTLQELADAFGVPPPVWITRERKHGSCPKRRNGQRAMYRCRLHQFEALREYRGGFRHGHRYRAALLYAKFLGRLQTKPEELEHAVWLLGRGCTDSRGRVPDPLPPKQCLKAAATWHQLTRISNATISAWLDVSPEESAFLSQEFGNKAWPASPRHAGDEDRPPADRPPTRERKIATRRTAISRIARATHGPLPTVREIARLLDLEQISASVSTVQRDLQALNLKNPRGRSTRSGSGSRPVTA